MSQIIPLLFAIIVALLIFLFANWAERNREQNEPYGGQAFMSYIMVAILFGLLLFIREVIHLSGAVDAAVPNGEIANTLRGFLNEAYGTDQFVANLPAIGLGLWLPSLIALLLLLPPLRKVVARFTHIDPASPVHAVALSLTMLIFVQLLVTLGIGLDTIATGLSTQNELNPDGASETLGVLWVQQIGMALIGLVGIGWIMRRDSSTSLARLAITPITLKQLFLGITTGLIMVPVVMVLEMLGNAVLGLGVDPSVEALSEELFGPLMQSPFGIATIGLSAALGEETLFRGAAQPRFGLFFTAAAFAIVHSNYGLSLSTVIVFILGLVLGLVRIRHNTTTAMIVHAVYNSTLGIISYLSMSVMNS